MSHSGYETLFFFFFVCMTVSYWPSGGQITHTGSCNELIMMHKLQMESVCMSHPLAYSTTAAALLTLCLWHIDNGCVQSSDRLWMLFPNDRSMSQVIIQIKAKKNQKTPPKNFFVGQFCEWRTSSTVFFSYLHIVCSSKLLFFCLETKLNRLKKQKQNCFATSFSELEASWCCSESASDLLAQYVKRTRNLWTGSLAVRC